MLFSSYVLFFFILYVRLLSSLCASHVCFCARISWSQGGNKINLFPSLLFLSVPSWQIFSIECSFSIFSSINLNLYHYCHNIQFHSFEFSMVNHSSMLEVEQDIWAVSLLVYWENLDWAMASKSMQISLRTVASVVRIGSQNYFSDEKRERMVFQQCLETV